MKALFRAAVIQVVGDVQGFVREASRTIVIEGKTPAELLDKLAAYKRMLSAPIICLTCMIGMPWCCKITFEMQKMAFGKPSCRFDHKAQCVRRFDPVLGHYQFWAGFPYLVHLTYLQWVTLMLTCVFLLCCHEH